ncbi:hypothetical protein BDZ45DRAFT_803340 [Acephala macrosclerotiorum]|nr:hypothetical protein BDZ45DRAFT_803340 [Acephala macrosclerotiorum]
MWEEADWEEGPGSQAKLNSKKEFQAALEALDFMTAFAYNQNGELRAVKARRARLVARMYELNLAAKYLNENMLSFMNQQATAIEVEEMIDSLQSLNAFVRDFINANLGSIGKVSPDPFLQSNVSNMKSTTRRKGFKPCRNGLPAPLLGTEAKPGGLTNTDNTPINEVPKHPLLSSGLRHRMVLTLPTSPSSPVPQLDPIAEQQPSKHHPPPLWKRGCVLIIASFTTFVFLGCFLGVYFTTQKQFGYSMGDSFTLAGFVITVGAFVSSAFLAYHYRHCKCWKRYEKGKGVELELLVEEGE